MTITRSLTRSITRALTRPITQAGAGGGGAFVPDADFFAGRKGYALDLTDATKLFQNINGTGAVTADGDPVGYATDLSGNGAHHTAPANDGTRPLYKTGDPRVLFDGVDSVLASAAIDFTGTDKLTIIVAASGSSVASVQDVVRVGQSSVYASLRIISNTRRSELSGSSGVSGLQESSAISTPYSRVMSSVFDIAGATATDEIALRVNGASVPSDVSSAGPAGSGNFASSVCSIGALANGLFVLDGSIYRVIVIGGTVTAGELLQCEQWCGAGAGLFF